MSHAVSIALNRFGLGWHRGQQVPADPQSWLTRQIDRYEATPPLLAGRRTDTGILTALISQFAEARQMKRMARKGETEVDLKQVKQKLRSGGKVYISDVALRGQVAAASSTPFMERLAHFWSNHFAISVKKLQLASLAGPYEFAAIRPHISGSFADLLKSAVLHPAMLVYLDQYQSIGPDSPAMRYVRRRRKGARERGLNENLAREVLELHTLGVDGGYSQADVVEFARALTGWTLSGLRFTERGEEMGNGTTFLSIAHQPGSRTVMGRGYPQEGKHQALAILDDLAVHPATARHIATKLTRHFAGDDPPAAMVSRLESAFLQSGGDLPAIYRAIVASPEAWVEHPVKFRQPWEWTVAMLRALGIEEMPEKRWVGILNQLGQQPWRPGAPAGYDDLAASWAGPDALLRRAEVAERVAEVVRLNDVRKLALAMFPGALSPNTAAAIARAESNNQALALLLVAPEMLRR